MFGERWINDSTYCCPPTLLESLLSSCSVPSGHLCCSHAVRSSVGRERQEPWKNVLTLIAPAPASGTSSSLSSLMVSLGPLPDSPERGHFQNQPCPPGSPYAAAVASHPASLTGGGSLCPSSAPGPPPWLLYLPRGWQALALCPLQFQLGRPGSDHNPSETQIPQTHTNKTLSLSGPGSAPTSPNRWWILNSLALTWSLSPQLPGATCSPPPRPFPYGAQTL